jgi:hypothetical protein
MPRITTADVRVPAAEQLLGQAAPTTIGYHADYLSNGFTAASGVFAQVATDLNDGTTAAAQLAIGFAADKAGGFATPNMALTTFSRTFGPLANKAANALLDDFSPSDYFPVGAAKLFGALDLGQLIKPGKLGPDAPKMRITRQAKSVTTTLDWTPNLIDTPPAFGLLTFTPHDAKGLAIHAVITRPIDQPGAAGTYQMSGTLTNFTLSFAGVIQLDFAAFAFTARSGQKLNVQASLKNVTFTGDLDFVNQLSRVIPSGAMDDGPSIDVSPTNVHVGYALAIPQVPIGVFELQGLNVIAGLDLPFLDGNPTFDFALAERHHPFLITVEALGGGGFLHVQLDAHEVKLIEGALEFGGSYSLDIGVASGGVQVLAGIYFALQNNQSTLSGFLRCGGEVSVLGIVSVSVEFDLSFTYNKPKVQGRATLTVAVHVAFFSKSVDLTVERSYGRDGGDPTFGEVMDVNAWNAYAGAFA